MPTPPSDAPPPEPHISWWQVLFGLTGMVGFFVVALLLLRWYGLERLQQQVQDAGPAAPLAYITLRAATNVIAPLNAGPLEWTSAAIFGLGPALVYSVLGEFLGCLVAFVLARWFGRGVVQRLVGARNLASVDRYLEAAGGWRTLLHARVLLWFAYEFVSYAAGLTRIPAWQYALVTFVAGIVPVFVAVGLGGYLAGVVGVWVVGAVVLTLVGTAIVLLHPHLRPSFRLPFRLKDLFG